MGSQKVSCTFAVAAAVLFACVAAQIDPASRREYDFNDQRYIGVLERTGDSEMMKRGLCDTVEQESGYWKIQGSVNYNLFYWFFESRRAPESDPVIFWMTGGPGCSDSVAIFHENGPCKITPDGQSTTINPYSWNSEASILFMDQPAGVGFSYGDAADEDTGEAGVSEHMYNFLHGWFAAHPKFQGRPLYIFGESYGGHYVPATTAKIGKSLPIAGMGIGNGLTDPLIQYQYYGQLAYNWTKEVLGKPVLSLQQYERIQESIPSCISMIKKCQSDTNECANAEFICNSDMLTAYQITGKNVYDFTQPCRVPPLCYNFTDVSTFLNSPSTQKALGVRPTTWTSCNNTVNPMFSSDWMKNFQTDVAKVLRLDIPVLIYAGDYDFICNWLGNKAWTLQFKWAGHDAFNKAEDTKWMLKDKEVGVVRTAKNLTFLQVHAAGHMVPFDQPEVALAMVNTFMDGDPFTD